MNLEHLLLTNLDIKFTPFFKKDNYCDKLWTNEREYINNICFLKDKFFFKLSYDWEPKDFPSGKRCRSNVQTTSKQRHLFFYYRILLTLYSSIPSLQFPKTHGPVLQSSSLFEQIRPLNPLGQTQVNILTPSMHFPIKPIREDSGVQFKLIFQRELAAEL